MLYLKFPQDERVSQLSALQGPFGSAHCQLLVIPQSGRGLIKSVGSRQPTKEGQHCAILCSNSQSEEIILSKRLKM